MASRLTMTDGGNERGQAADKAAKGSRETRLKLALRENLKRRKSQARERGDFMPASPGSAELARDRSEESPDK
jgi:hypothetical protein